MGYQPTVKGFDIDDSFFEEYEGGPRKGRKKLYRKVKVERVKVVVEKSPKKPKDSDSSSSESEKKPEEVVVESEGSLYETQSYSVMADEPDCDFDIYDNVCNPNIGLNEKRLTKMFIKGDE